jgi:hypothetical protein
VVSEDADWMTIDIKDYYLGTQMPTGVHVDKPFTDPRRNPI